MHASGHVERKRDAREGSHGIGEYRKPTNGGAHGFRRFFSRIATFAANATGSAWAFVAAAGIVLAWALTGPIFGFSDTWQLVINTSTTIVTFLMVFLIQHAQNKDTHALHLKLNELIAAQQGASNRLIDVEDLSEEELAELHKRFQEMKGRVEDIGVAVATSVEESAPEK